MDEGTLRRIKGRQIKEWTALAESHRQASERAEKEERGEWKGARFAAERNIVPRVGRPSCLGVAPRPRPVRLLGVRNKLRELAWA